MKKSRPVKVIFETIQDKGKVSEVYWERKGEKSLVLEFQMTSLNRKNEKYKKLKEEAKIREAKGQEVTNSKGKNDTQNLM